MVGSHRIFPPVRFDWDFGNFGEIKMKKLLLAGTALLAVPGVASAQLDVSVSGSVEFGYSRVDDNVVPVISSLGSPVGPNTDLFGFGLPSPGLASIPGLNDTAATVAVWNLVYPTGGPLAVPAFIGTPARGSSDGFTTSGGFTVKASGATEKMVYDGVLDYDVTSAGLDMDEAKITMTTRFGRFRVGYGQTSEGGADQISVGKSGVTTDVVGAEYAERFEGTSIEYGIAFGDFAGGVNWGGDDNFGLAGQYETALGAAGVKLTGRYFNQGTPSGGTSKTLVGYQVAAVVDFDNWKIAASYSDEQAEDYAPLNANQALSMTALGLPEENDDVSAQNYGIAVAYDMGALQLSADYAGGTVTTSFLGTPTAAYGAANAILGSVSDADYSAYSVGASYRMAPGLTLNAGYKVFNDQVVLNSDTSIPNAAAPTVPATAYAGGVQMKDQSEIAASIKLSF